MYGINIKKISITMGCIAEGWIQEYLRVCVQFPTLQEAQHQEKKQTPAMLLCRLNCVFLTFEHLGGGFLGSFFF